MSTLSLAQRLMQLVVADIKSRDWLGRRNPKISEASLEVILDIREAYGEVWLGYLTGPTKLALWEGQEVRADFVLPAYSRLMEDLLREKDEDLFIEQSRIHEIYHVVKKLRGEFLFWVS